MKTAEHIYSPLCAACRDEAGNDRAGVPDDDLCAWHLLAALAEERERRERAERRSFAVVAGLVAAMKRWANEEDGVPDFAWKAYKAGGEFVVSGPPQPGTGAALRAAPAQPHSSRCACRTGDGPGLHDDGGPVTLPTPLDGDGRDGFNGPGPFEG